MYKAIKNEYTRTETRFIHEVENEKSNREKHSKPSLTHQIHYKDCYDTN